MNSKGKKGEDEKMTKTELLKLIEALGDEDDVLESLKGIEGLAKSSELDVNKLTIEDYKNILENNKEIKGYNKSNLDSAISTAINSHDKKFTAEKLPSIIEAELKKKSNEGKTEDQIKYEDLQKEFEKMKAENAREKLSSKYSKVLNEKQLPIELVDYILSDDEEKINSNIEFFSNLITNSVNNGVKQRLGNFDETPPKDESLNEEELLNKQIEQAMGIR